MKAKWFLPAFVALVAIVLLLICLFKSAPGEREKIGSMLNRGEASKIHLNRNNWLRKYYEMIGFSNDSITPAVRNNYVKVLGEMLACADSLGLDTSGFHSGYIRHCDSICRPSGHQSGKSALEDELIFNDAVLAIFYKTAYGDTPPFRFNGIKTDADSGKVLRAFHTAMSNGNWRTGLNSMEPSCTAYRKLKASLLQYEAFTQGDSAKPGIDSVFARLKAYHIIADTSTSYPRAKAIKQFQFLAGLDTNGVADPKTLQALGIPLKERVMQLKQSLNYYRWLNRLTDTCIVVVNIPGANLRIYKGSNAQSPTMMKVIAGKQSWQTPVFAAYIDGITTYPYWVVPRDIAVKEMLSQIRKNLDYLDENNLQVMDRTGKEIDPETINWKQLSADNFPYTVRQSTGCDNSLGVLKFDVNSPFSIYLHDTNAKGLFNNQNRLLSHGCIRVENAMLLAQTLTGYSLPSKIIDELTQCIQSHPPSSIKLKQKCPLLVVYMVADVDENGELRFYPDTYHLNN